MASGSNFQKEMVTAVARDVLAEKGTIFSVEAHQGEKCLRDIAIQLELLILGFNVISKASLLRVMQSAETSSPRTTLHGHLQNLPLEGLWSSNDCGIYMGSSEVQYIEHDQIRSLKGSFNFIQVEESQQLNDFDMNRINLLAAASGATVVFFGQDTGAESSFRQLTTRNKRAQSEMGGITHFSFHQWSGEPQGEEMYLRAS